jgi:transposase
MAKKSKRGRGRPPVFTGNQKRHIVAVVRKNGLTGAQRILADEGVSITLPTLGKFAKEAGIELSRGRPKVDKPKETKPVEAPAEAA